MHYHQNLQAANSNLFVQNNSSIANNANGNNCKFVSPKSINIRKLTSSSNLPTANNSFYTISSLDQNEWALNEEYQDISYKNSKNIYRSNKKLSYPYNNLSNNKIVEDNEASDENFSIYSNNNSLYDANSFHNYNLSSNNNYCNINNNNTVCNNKTTSEFKTKYKTEICKFWQLNNSCRFGDNVSFFFL